ncbi:DegT/DnrJ/EryC1/StrS family aminotransferase [Polluticaenibacter yanchengensis]|uniref:DegT/DnrJ/EryC1/StrS family aminotransferase n=1 Tax=Polluticaenibacter yanchengensis TaxID=3014562 RepID=A0ABT4UID2_9BACT|nr:DegT/DnrJ/EryC1/StrS family aminotransferase [Chitinophagaceae bacterium LY-5]
MDAIQMVDLKKQYKKIKSEVDAAVINVLESSAFINGKPVQDFASNLSNYLGVKHVIPCANGTDALQIALMALGLQPGDEVITPSFTYIATVEVVALLKLVPVFVDVDPATFCMDPEKLKKLITPKTKAIIPVHLYGHAAPMEEILDIAKSHNLFVIEDNAQAIGGTYTFSNGTTKKLGSLGHIGCTSFFPSKNLGGYGDGGAIFTNDDALAEILKKVANHGQSVRYYHDIVGCNSRLDTIQAAVLDIKLKHLDEYIDARRNAASFYNQAFGANEKLITPKEAAYSKHVFHQYTLLLEGVDRAGLMKYLADNGIPSMLYYPLACHKQKMFETLNVPVTDLEVTEWLSERVISLPMHTELTDEQLEHITKTFINYIN